MNAFATTKTVHATQCMASGRRQSMFASNPTQVLSLTTRRVQLKPCRSTEQEPTTSSQDSPNSEQQAAAQQQSPVAESSGFQLKEGQGTAIITGGISIVIAVLYLLMVVALDIRGGELLPPPPEAFIP